MSIRRGRIAALALPIALLAASAASGQPSNGPDVIVGDLPDLASNAPVTIGGVSYKGFAVGTTSCNKGNTPLLWFTGGTDNRHPAISQNLFRYSPTTGRFEQIGQGSLKHGFTALQGTTCSSYFGFGCTATGGTTLGVGCSDPYGAGLNNNPGGMGPKWQVNAATGLFPYPYPTNANSGPVRVRMTELNASPAGSRYFIEGQYIVGDDAAAGNKNNNASWREVSIAASAGTVPNATNFSIAFSAGTGGVIHREQPAIYAWQAVDPTVTISTFDVPNDGRFVLGCKVSGSGPYTYEYALFNLNSHRCAGSIVIPLPGSQNALSGVGFSGAEAVGEPDAYPDPTNPSASDWVASGTDAGSTSVSWAGPAHVGALPNYTPDASVNYKVASFVSGGGNDHSAHVIRWGSMFNFRFTSEVAPASTGSIAVGLWRPGTGTSFVMTNIPTPGGSTVGSLSAACCNGTSCSIATQAACAGGVWGLPGTTCSPNPCINGACCLTNLTCSQYNSTDCTAQGGTYMGDGSACASNPCPTGACCSDTSSACTMGGTSCAAGSTYMGLHTSCGAPPCPTGACCNTSTAACSVGGIACPSGSTFMGAGTACGAVVCVVTEYCAAGSNGCATGPSDERISQFTIGAINNNSGTGNGPTGCYSDFRSNSTTLIPGQTYAVTLLNASAYSGDQAAVWIDWNHNLTFFDTGEQFTLSTANAGATFTGSVVVPSNAPPGSTRMRTRVTWTGTLSPCGSTTYGEVEDYTIVVPLPGTCCRGATCNTSVSQASCTGSGLAGALYITSAGNTCNTAGSTTMPCCHADYNKTSGVTVQDIFDFINDWFAGSSFTSIGGDGSPQPLVVQNIFDYLNAWFAGCL